MQKVASSTRKAYQVLVSGSLATTSRPPLRKSQTSCSFPGLASTKANRPNLRATSISSTTASESAGQRPCLESKESFRSEQGTAVTRPDARSAYGYRSHWGSGQILSVTVHAGSFRCTNGGQGRRLRRCSVTDRQGAGD